MTQFPPLVDTRIVRPTETALALKLVGELELLRLKTLARWYARGLPRDVTWEDLLQEAFTRVIVGARQVPAGVTAVAFIAGVMRSLRSEHWRRVEKRSLSARRAAGETPRGTPREVEVADEAAGPERALMAQQELAAIRRLFAEDPVALQILDSVAQGQLPEEICRAAQLSAAAYASARKRIRRVLLREGLTCTPR
jgi:DNA-directed RNA polymerase specialized sigma24 family protein